MNKKQKSRKIWGKKMKMVMIKSWSSEENRIEILSKKRNAKEEKTEWN